MCFRHHVILQIRQDLLTGRLKCPVQTMSHLCSYWLQSEYGDWSSRHIDMQLADAFRFVQKGEKSSEGQEGRSDLNFEEQVRLFPRQSLQTGLTKVFILCPLLIRTSVVSLLCKYRRCHDRRHDSDIVYDAPHDVFSAIAMSSMRLRCRQMFHFGHGDTPTTNILRRSLSLRPTV